MARSEDGFEITAPPIPRSVIVSTVFINLLALALPLTILQVYDRVLPNKALDTLSVLIAGLIFILVLDVIMKLARSYLVGWSGSAFAHNASLEAFRRMMKAPSSVMEKDTVSVHMSRLNSLSVLGDFYSGPARLLMIDLPAVSVFVIIMGLVGGSLILIPFVMFILFAILAHRRNLRLDKLIKERSVHDNRKSDFVIDILSGIHTVKATAMEPQMQRRYERLLRRTSMFNYESIHLGSTSQANSSLYTGISTVMIVSYGAVLAINGQITIGALACCTLLSGQIIQPLLRGISVWSELQNIAQKRSEALELFDQLHAVPETSSVTTATGGAISIRNLTYRYSKELRPVFEGLNLEIADGEVVGFRGGDGHGRSTLMRLIHGDLQPESGEISIAGESVTGSVDAALRHGVILVGQKPAIFRGSILENLTLFKKGLAIPRARKAAELIGLDRDIQKYPEGYDMKLGEGVAEDVPAAFAQRIAIARALAHGPRVLILDEANTTLDRTDEKKLVAAIEKLRGYMTILIISNRPSFLAISNRLFDLKDGNLTPVMTEASTLARGAA